MQRHMVAATLLTLSTGTAVWAQDVAPDPLVEKRLDPCVALETEPPPVATGEAELTDAELRQLRIDAFTRAQNEERCYRQQIEREQESATDAKEKKRLARITPPPRTSKRVLGGTRAGGVPFQVEIGYNPDLRAETLINSGRTAQRQAETRNALAGRAAWDWKHLCGGSLIEPNLVLTAAHCVTEAQFNFGSGIVARLGAEDLASPNSLFVKIDRVVRHAGYDKDDPKRMFANDIALLRLVPYAPSRRVKAITPNTNPALDFKSKFRIVTGWGKSGTSGARYMRFLQQINVAVHTTSECRTIRNKNREDNVALKAHDGVLCASAMGVKSCEGDSGGPLFGGGRAPLLVGIVSWNRDGCRERSTIHPGGYTRVSRYTGWIARAKSALTRGTAFQRLP